MVARWSFSESTPFATIRNVWDPQTKTSNYRLAADYWVLLIHKATVGRNVLSTDVPKDSPVLAYASCGKHGNGSVVISISNPSNTAVTLGLDLPHTPRFEYVLTAPSGNLSSVAPVLNGGAQLELSTRGELPDAFAPAFVGDGTITVPAHACGFFVLLEAGAVACKSA